MRIIKIGDTIYENFEVKVSIPTEFNEEGEPIGFTEGYMIDISKMKEYIKDTLIWLAGRLLNEKLAREGYYDIGDLLVFKDTEATAQGLYNWYLRFNQLLWDFIENELPNRSNESLLDFDCIAYINQIAQ